MNENILNPVLTLVATMVGGIISYLATKQILGDECKKQNKMRELQKKEEAYITAMTVLTELYAEMPINANTPKKNAIQVNGTKASLTIYGTKEIVGLFYDCVFEIIEMKRKGTKMDSEVSELIDSFAELAMEDLKETKKDIE